MRKALLVLFTLVFLQSVSAQKHYYYETTTSKVNNNGDNRKVKVVIHISIDSLYTNIVDEYTGFYGFYYSYDIKFYELSTNIPLKEDEYKFDNFRLKLYCGEEKTDEELSLTGGKGTGLAYNDKSLKKEDHHLADLDYLSCNQIKIIMGGPGIQETVILDSDTPLPIELLSFSAEPTEHSITLKWETASELNNDYFTIERSKDGLFWEEIKEIEGAGNSNRLIHYQYVDNSPLNGISYYRLSQTDFDGTKEEFDIISVNYDRSNKLSLYPNPASNTVHINGEGVLIFSILGENLTNHIQYIGTKEGNSTFDISSLRAGTYIVHVNNQQIKLIKR